MPDYLLLMHDDGPGTAAAVRQEDWDAYLGGLQASGHFQGGSAIGPGICARKSGQAPAVTAHLSGFIRVSAVSLDEARKLLAGNPVFEAGGTIEIRELPRSRFEALRGLAGHGLTTDEIMQLTRGDSEA